MRRMRLRSVATHVSSAGSYGSWASGARGGNYGGTTAGGGGGGGDASNHHPEGHERVGDRWRKLYYQVRVSQRLRRYPAVGNCQARRDSEGKTPKPNMGVNPMKWKTRTFAYVCLSVIAFFILFVYKRTHNVSFDATIKNSKPEQVWEFVADFSNMMLLNPTIKDFSILAESGNYDHWKYSARYTEHLSHIPMIENTAHGHFAVKPDGDGFLISSEHRTCFFSSFGCLDSVSDFRFVGEGQDTKCVETVQYECPIVFSNLCYKEVMYQRQEIMKNLKSHFLMANSDKNSKE